MAVYLLQAHSEPSAHGNRSKESMKSSTKDRIQGEWHESKGKAKETLGWMAKRPDIAAEGVDEKAAGIIQKKAGQIKKALGK
jgi:uncharacterized protein YjbJ (UPF0337 family)